jgi:hypothetical protein
MSSFVSNCLMRSSDVSHSDETNHDLGLSMQGDAEVQMAIYRDHPMSSPLRDGT